ncbi:MAG: discoidin domain-containing protein [Verrucomicrobia bacterium]|nr:discoidin domain-containing protein [Verrucomicrobiota bacterium]
MNMKDDTTPRPCSPQIGFQHGTSSSKSAAADRPLRRRLAGGLVLALTAAHALAASLPLNPSQPNEFVCDSQSAKFVRVLLRHSQGEPCLDELEVYGTDSGTNLALASNGAKASASSLLPGYAMHQIAHLNDGLYGNSYSWIAAGSRNEWAQIELAQPRAVSRIVISRDREGRFSDRMPGAVEVRLSDDGQHWRSVAKLDDGSLLADGPLTEEDLLRYAFAREAASVGKVDATEPCLRVLRQMDEMLMRLGERGLDTRRERAELDEFQRRAASPALKGDALTELRYQARLAKRRLFLRDPDLVPLERILFVKRQAYEPSHNYSDIFDPQGGPGGGVCVLDIPNEQGCLAPGRAKLTTLFDARNGVARDPALTCDARTVWFGYRTTKQDYFHLWRMNVDGSDIRQMTDGPFYDYYPCPLPDGGVAFMSTRCKARFLCWRPQAFVLFRMAADGSNIQPLSYANVSEWAPAVMRDGRLLWTRSEYLDKGANFGHTLWAIRPDGSHPELIFGNNTTNCYVNGHEVPGTREIVCTLISHGGDLNGPIALIDPQQGRSNPKAITSLTPDVPPQYDMTWLRQNCFRDPYPISRDLFLCSHAADDKFGLYVIDRWGNRELLYLDPSMGSMAPMPLRPSAPSPALSQTLAAEGADSGQGQLVVADVYRGLEPQVKRGQVKYIRVCQEVRADLIRLAGGDYQQDHETFQDWYATPVDKVSGPHGWPSYVAKGVLGIVPVEADGSASFFAPAGKVLYFQVLDGNFNELQRMRSVVQLQAGETRGCIGCHEDRMSVPPLARTVRLAMQRPPRQLEPPPWGAGPFAYEKVVQPVWDAKCVSCHDAQDKDRINFAGTPDGDGVPASYRTLIERGWVHYFDWNYGQRHNKAEPLSFGTVKSRLCQVLEAGHYQVALTPEESQRVKTWIDLNCPLWPDYINRPQRRILAQGTANLPPK